MRNFLALLAAGFFVFAGLGWYLGWYKVTSTPGADGHRQISIDVNTPKIQEDVSTGKAKLRDALSNDKDQSAKPKPPAPESTNGSRPTDDGGFVFPAHTVTPPSGTPRLPMPQ